MKVKKTYIVSHREESKNCRADVVRQSFLRSMSVQLKKGLSAYLGEKADN